jgi:penicillin-binding protein 1A
VSSYARERRVQLRFVDFPPQLINAFLSAEDKTFWTHGGVDLTGLAGAVVDYVTKYGSGERARGGSTITQQVAKNILIGNEYSVTRKLKEMLLARRIESVLTKQQILELYLNEIPLGRQSFGVQAAARPISTRTSAIFRSTRPLSSRSCPRRLKTTAAPNMPTRRWPVATGCSTRCRRMAGPADVAQAKAQPLGLVARRSENYTADAGYFLEEVRRQLIDRFGEQAKDGPNSVYAGGCGCVPRSTSSCRPPRRMPCAGAPALWRGRPWHGPIAHIDMDRTIGRAS